MRRIDAVVNCVGILMQGAGQTFERVHARGPGELFKGAALAGVHRVVQVSVLGVRDCGLRWYMAQAAPVPHCLPRRPACR